MPLILSASMALFLLAPAYVADSVQGDWVFPQIPNYATTMQLGIEYKIQWTSALQDWFQYYCPDCNTTSVDLWATSSNNNNKQEHKVASGVDITLTLSVAWTATVPTSELSDSRTWVFRFVPSGEDPSSTSEEISSSIFIISDPDAASPFSTTVSSPAIDSTSPTPISNTSPVTTSSDPLVSTNPTTTTSAIVGTETMTTSQSSSGLSTGMRAGIGVGAGAGAVILFAFGWFLARYHGRKSSTTGTGVAKQRNPGPFRKAPHELDGTAPQTTHTNIFPETYYQHPVEVDSSQAYYR